MKKKITKELERLIERANKKLEAAKDARNEVMAYIEDHYDINTREYYDILEDECSWCYGIDMRGLEYLINAKNKGDI